ncbi:hypothetical protein Tco_0818804 [Tanacetum coccineum]
MAVQVQKHVIMQVKLEDEENKDDEAPENEDSEVPNIEESRVNQEKDENVNSTNNINTISSTVNTASIEDNAVDENIVYGCANDPNMPNLEEIDYSNDDEGVGAEADMNNLDTFMPVSPIPTTRIHKDHPFSATEDQPQRFLELFICLFSITSRNQEGNPSFDRSKLDRINACACARFQVTPKVSHLHVVKIIFRYLKGQPKLGFWYPKDSPFVLEAYTDSDYAGASLDRKSITGGCQFLRRRLISWQCKKQTVVANSKTKAEYVAASNCTICIVKNPVFHSKTKHIEIRHHFIRDSNEKKLIQMIKIHTDHNVVDLLTKAFDQIIHKGWLKWDATTTEDGIEAKVSAARLLTTARLPLVLQLLRALKFANSHNMVVYLQKSMENADFDEIVDFLNAYPIQYALTGEGEDTSLSLGKRCEKNYLSVRRYVADPDNAYPKLSITKLILKGAVTFDVVSYQFRYVMAAPFISISFDTSEESMGSHAPRLILFGVIPAIIPEVPVVPADPIVTPEEGTISFVSPSEVLDLVDYSPSFDSDPSEDSLPPAPDLPLVSPFLCSDNTEADGESEPAKQRPVSSSHDTLAPLSEFLLTLRVRPISTHRLTWRCVSHHSSDRHSSPDLSSSSAPLDHSLSRYTPPDTTDVDSSTLQRFLHRSLARTLRHSEAFRCRRPSRKRCRFLTASVPSPTYVTRSIAPTPIDLLPPRKRFRDLYSREDSGEEHMEVDIADAEVVTDIGISEGVVAHHEDGVGMGFEITASDVREDDKEFEVEASAIDTRKIIVDPLVISDSSKSSRGGIPDLEDTIHDIVHYMLEVYIDRITEIETTQRQLETSQMVASRERASLVERIGSLRLEYLKVRAILSIERDWIDSIRWYMALSQEEFHQVRRDRDDTQRRLRRTMTITCFGMTPEAIEELINRRVEEELAAHEATRAANALEAENQSQNGSDGGNGDGENRNGENGNGGNGNPNENGRGDRPVARECTYQDFMKCQPLNFKGTEGVVRLIRWFEKMETVFHISNCPEKSQVKYATCTLLNSALTW